jgi:hypothetical protein
MSKQFKNSVEELKMKIQELVHIKDKETKSPKIEPIGTGASSKINEIELINAKALLADSKLHINELTVQNKKYENTITNNSKKLEQAINNQNILVKEHKEYICRIEEQHRKDLEETQYYTTKRFEEYIKEIKNENNNLKYENFTSRKHLEQANAEIDRLTYQIAKRPGRKNDDPDQNALEDGILLSSQQSQFGTNMFDSLKPEDEVMIDLYMKQNLTRKQAILKIFEEKYGKTHRERYMSMVLLYLKNSFIIT